LANFTIVAANEDKEFIARQVGNFVPVDHKKDTYYEYGKSAWNRLEMAPRGPSEESHGAGWTLSTGSYDCERWAVHKDFDWSDEADTDDALDLDLDAAAWGENQIRLKLDSLVNAAVMTAATWTTDYDGVSGTPGANEIKQWDQSASTPQADHMTLNGTVKGLCGKDCNTMIMGHKVFRKLITHSVVRDAIKYTDPTMVRVVQSKLAAFFGVEQLFVGGAFYESAAEGATSSVAFLINEDDLWAGYLSKEVKKRTYTAWKVFAYKDGGRAVDGLVTRKFDIEAKTTTRYEFEMFVDVKVIAADAGYFVDGCVA
jgi:hypothetical protein